VASTDVLDPPEYKAAASTPWRNRVAEQAISREKRTFGFHKSFG
jgi:hypothetical protein